MRRAGIPIAVVWLLALTAVSLGGGSSTTNGPALQMSKLRQNCASAVIPRTKTYSRYDLATRTIVVMWRDQRRRRNVEVRLPYEPETDFRPCSPSARGLLSHVHLVYEQIDRNRAYWLERAKKEGVDPTGASSRWSAVLFYGSLRENCAHYKPPRTADNFALDPSRRFVISGWWEPLLNQNVTILLPYEPKTGFAGCTKEAKALLRLYQEMGK